MGNLITTTVAIFSPLLTREYIIPAVMHPYKWGGVPFVPPGPVKYAFLYMLFNFLLIGSAATISGLMTTAKECKKIQLWTAIVNARWAMLFAAIGMLILLIFPFIKGPLLSFLSWMPYATHIASGIYLGLAVLIGGMIGNGYNRKNVCYD